MSDSFKRTLIDGDQRSSPLNHTDISPELTAQLRNVGQRIRKSVTEGYVTPPTSRAFTKAQSTTTIFSSARDINRDVFSPPLHNTLNRAGSGIPNKKRSRSADRSNDNKPNDASDCEAPTSNNIPTDVPAPQVLNHTDRIMKPLRKNRRMMETRSLPAGALRFSHQTLNSTTIMAPTMEAEEDWSVQSTSESALLSFKPVIYD